MKLRTGSGSHDTADGQAASYTGVSAAQDLTEFFLHQARVACSDGAAFGPGGEGFVRLNFGCPRSLLLEALEWMKQALK